MSNVNTVISFEQLVEDFDSLFRHRVFRLETLDWYDAPNEHEPYRRFLAGQPVDPAWREPWKRLVRDVRASRRIMERVHIVSEPVSDYIRFELLHAYPANVEAGEDVRILSRTVAERLSLDLAIPGDFWLVRHHLTALLAYDDSGAVSRVELQRDPRLVRWHAHIRTELMFSLGPPSSVRGRAQHH